MNATDNTAPVPASTLVLATNAPLEILQLLLTTAAESRAAYLAEPTDTRKAHYVGTIDMLEAVMSWEAPHAESVVIAHAEGRIAW